jgi:large subunit ribosomal protein L5
MSEEKINPMREIRIHKIVINIGCGEAGEKLDRAKKLLMGLVGKESVCVTKTSSRTTFGMPKGRAIGVKLILRRAEAMDFLKKAFESVDNKIKKTIFDKQGGFSFGIKEHISFPGVRYDPSIGIYGMDVCVSLERRGYRVMRKRGGNKISKKHRITSDEALGWVQNNFNVKIE